MRGQNFPSGDIVEEAVRGHFISVVFAVLIGVTGGILSGWFIWLNAPVVGGEYWPYIQTIAALIGAFLGGKVFSLLGYFVSGAVYTAYVNKNKT